MAAGGGITVSEKPLIIKYGGSIAKDAEATEAFMEDIALLRDSGAKVAIVHGGGPEINNMLVRLELKGEFIKGLRVTDKAAMEVVEMVLSGRVNKALASGLSGKGVEAVGISGRDCRLIEAEKLYMEEDGERMDLGFVGRVTGINIKLVRDLMDMGYVPVISPVAGDKEGNSYNVNADYAAAAIGASLKADRLVYLSDVEGLFADVNDRNTLIKVVTASKVKELIDSGSISGGMIPKMECCIDAVRQGVKAVCLIGGGKPHALLELISGKAVGTIIKGGDHHVEG